jgi:cobyrinic acid a,c-diamide synthase
MYLGRRLIVNGQPYDMAGVLDVDFEMHAKPQGHGYTVCKVTAENPFLPVGLTFRGHEFHYSRPAPLAPLRFAYRVERGRGILEKQGGLLRRQVLGTYHHVHTLGLPEWAPGLVDAARGGTQVP